MILSTRMKFTLLIFGSLGLLAAATGFFTSFRVRQAVSEKLRENSDNAVGLSASNARDVYQSLFQEKVAQVVRLKEIMRLQETTIRNLAGMEGDFFDTLARLALPQGFSLWVLGDDLKIRFRSGDMQEGVNPYTLRDIKGREIGANMLRLAQDEGTASALVQIDSRAGRPIRFFGQHFFLPETRLLVGLWVDIRPQEEQERQGRAEAIRTLSETFQGIRLGASGYLMVIDESGGVVIRPRDGLTTPDMASVNPLSGNSLLHDIKQVSEMSGTSFPGEIPSPGGPRKVVVFAERVRPLKWYVIGIGFVDEIEATGRNLSMSLMLVTLAISAGLAFLAMLMVGKLTKPLVKLAGFARTLPKTDFFQAADDNKLLVRLATDRKGDEISELAKALLFMDGALRERVRELVETAGKRERMEGELHAATRIQMGFLPKPLPAEVVAGRFRLAAELIPAREVGGDLYDFFMLDENRLCLVIGDVSGKGVPAALFMSMTMMLFRSEAAAESSPEGIVTAINRNLTRNNVDDMFITLFVAIVDLRTGELAYANGGHNPPLVVSAEGARRLEGAGGPLVGAFETAKYEGTKTLLKTGETLFLYTDGVTEAMNSVGELFGDAALERLLISCSTEDPGKIIQMVHNAVKMHVAGAPPSDDLTMLCLQMG